MTQTRTRGLINDSISDMLTRIRNACLAKKSNVSIPFTRLNQQIAQILEKEGFIQSFQISLENVGSGVNSNSSIVSSNTEKLESALSISEPIANKRSAVSKKTEILIQLKYRSKTVYQGKKKESCITNLKRLSKPGLRIYTNHREIPRILGGTGIVLLSTPEGIMTDREARFRGIGGELLCAVW